MTYPIQPGPSYGAAPKIRESRQNIFSSSEHFNKNRRLTICSLIAAAASHHYEESHLIYGPFASILLDQGFLVEYELDDTLKQLPSFFLPTRFEAYQRKPFISCCH